MNPDSRQIAELAVKCAFDKKAEDIVILDMKDVTQICDYFVVVSGASRPQTKAIAEHIEETFEKELGLKEKRIQGKEEGSWILMDYGVVVIHLFLENLRKYYNLEGLWNKAKAEKLLEPPFPEPEKSEAGKQG